MFVGLQKKGEIFSASERRLAFKAEDFFSRLWNATFIVRICSVFQINVIFFCSKRDRFKV
jgi:hypothetical protein